MADWRVRINEGPEQPFSTRSGIYQDAAIAAYALLEYEPAAQGPDIVEIWVPELLPDYRPGLYGMTHDEYGRRCATVMVRRPDDVAKAMGMEE